MTDERKHKVYQRKIAAEKIRLEKIYGK